MLHLGVFLAAWIGVPALFSAPRLDPSNMEVELVSLEQKKKPASPEKRDEIKSKESPITSKPKRNEKKPSINQRKPTPPPPEIQKQELPPEPTSLPVPESKPKIKPVPKREVKKVLKAPPLPKRKPNPKTRKKPKSIQKPDNKFASLLKDLAAQKKKAAKRDEPNFDKMMKNLAEAKEKSQSTEIRKKLSVSKSDSDKKNSQFKIDQASLAKTLGEKFFEQVYPCWSIPAGAKGADRIKVDVRLRLKPDGSVSVPPVYISPMGMKKDPFHIAIAESALRALSNPRCMPVKLPIESYHIWKEWIVTFNPAGALGQ